MKRVPRTIIITNRPTTIDRKKLREVIQRLKDEREAAEKAARAARRRELAAARAKTSASRS